MGRVVVLTPNPAIDVTYRVASDERGESHRVTEVARRIGGKGLNVAAALNVMGHHPRLVLALGGWSGDWFRSRLDEQHLDYRAVSIDAETRFTVATVTEDGAHPTVFLEPGPVLDPRAISTLSAVLREALTGADALVVSGSLAQGIPPEIVGDWVRIARAAGIATIVDTSGDALMSAARAGADVVKPNATEAMAATGVARVDAAAAALITAGAATVIVSDGAAGIAGYTASGSIRVDAVAGVTGNPTGAGDAATAGVAAAFVECLDLESMLRRAAAAGAAAVLAPVAGELDGSAYRRFLPPSDPTKELL